MSDTYELPEVAEDENELDDEECKNEVTISDSKKSMTSDSPSKEINETPI